MSDWAGQGEKPWASVNPRQIGVRLTGSYWGAAGEQIDMHPGNLNYTQPLVKAQGRGGWGVRFPLRLAELGDRTRAARGCWAATWGMDLAGDCRPGRCASLGQFTTPDPTGWKAVKFDNPISWNRYAYVKADPVNLNDPTGLFDTSGNTEYCDVYPEENHRNPRLQQYATTHQHRG